MPPAALGAWTGCGRQRRTMPVVGMRIVNNRATTMAIEARQARSYRNSNTYHFNVWYGSLGHGLEEPAKEGVHPAQHFVRVDSHVQLARGAAWRGRWLQRVKTHNCIYGDVMCMGMERIIPSIGPAPSGGLRFSV